MPDTTSRIVGVGKKTAFQKLAKGDPVLRSCAIAFTIPNQRTEVIDNLGCQAMAVLFGGNGTDSLATMPYNIFSKKVVSASSFVSPKRLLPTESATKLLLPNFIVAEHTIPGHGLGRKRGGYGSKFGMDPRNWGWNLQYNRLVLLMSTMNAAPDNLLKIIHGNCSTSCKTLR